MEANYNGYTRNFNFQFIIIKESFKENLKTPFELISILTSIIIKMVFIVAFE